MMRSNMTTSRTTGQEAQEGPLAMKAAAVAAMQQSTKKNWGKDKLVLSPRGGGVTAHLAVSASQL